MRKIEVRMNTKRITKIIVVCICCLLLSACGQKSDKWLLLGFDFKTEIGLRQDPVETFSDCIKRRKSIPAAQFKKLFEKEAAIVRKNRSSADWGNLACLAFNESATAFQVKTAALLLPEEELSSDEAMVVGLIRPLLHKRAVTLGKLGNLERQLKNSLKVLNKLKEQVLKLQEIEGLLERK